MKVFARYILNSMPNRTALAPPFHEINITDALQSQPMIVHSGDKHNKNNYLWTSDNTKHLIPNGKTLRRMKKQPVFVDFLPKAVHGTGSRISPKTLQTRHKARQCHLSFDTFHLFKSRITSDLLAFESQSVSLLWCLVVDVTQAVCF